MLNSRQFKDIYQNFLESGLTVQGYCSNHHLAESTFYYWQNKLRRELPPVKGFVPLVFDSAPAQMPSQVPASSNNVTNTFSGQSGANQPFSCEISYPNGVSLKLSGATDPGLLRSLLFLLPQ
jgi:hypothetical protein